jgi:hypothetical protein
VARERLLAALFWGTAAAVVPVALLHFFGREQVYLPGSVHFGVVGASALAATGAAFALTAVGARRKDGRVVLLATAFSVMASLLLAHGLATPGFIVDGFGLAAVTGGLTLPVGGAVLALSALSPFRRPQHVRRLLWFQGTVLAAIAAFSTVGLLAPKLIPGVPDTLSPEAIALLVVGVLFYGVLALRAFRTFLLTRRSADLVVVCGVVWLGAALVAALTLDYWDLGWWLGHGLEVLGIGLIGGVVAWDLHRSAQSRPLMGDLRAAELVSAEEAFLGSHVRALMVRLAEKDEYTEGHTRRVALLAVRVGEQLGLAPGRLRHLAAGGLLHDIGKLAVPDEILKKPGPLTDEEFAVVRRHPEHGFRLLGDLGGFPDAVRRLVRGHHERLDGTGYPQALAADELDLELRILGPCDVYDALVSTRVYRDAWAPDDALGLLRAESGTAFDRRCVQALETVLEQAAAERPAGEPARDDGRAPVSAPAAGEPLPLLPSVPTVYAGTPGRIIRKP